MRSKQFKSDKTLWQCLFSDKIKETGEKIESLRGAQTSKEVNNTPEGSQTRQCFNANVYGNTSIIAHDKLFTFRRYLFKAFQSSHDQQRIQQLRKETYLVQNSVQASIERHLELLEQDLLRDLVYANVLGVAARK
jgi:hypothetical protein